MSDIEYLSTLESGVDAPAGAAVKVDSGEIGAGATGDAASITADTGKDMYVSKARITVSSTGSAPSGHVTCVLKLNGSIVETAKIGHTFAIARGAAFSWAEYVSVGKKVAAGQIIKLEVTVAGIQLQCSAHLECFEVNTGVTPRLP